jgi:hypothetical protein
MFCGQIHALATLSNYVHMHLMNTSFLPRLYSLKPRVFVFMPSNRLISFWRNILVERFGPDIPELSLIHSAKNCCYRNFDICCQALQQIFLLCTPFCTSLQKTMSCSVWLVYCCVADYGSQNRETLSQDILILYHSASAHKGVNSLFT